MKLFAIVTAGLMAAGGGIYFYSTSDCSKSKCSLSTAPVAKTGGCCSHDKSDGCSTQDESNVLTSAGSMIALNATGATTPSCCSAKEECCVVTAACCTVEKATAISKPVEIESCCAACVTPTLNVTIAAKSIATAK